MTATDLKQWAGQRQFHGLMPKILQKLIRASLGSGVKFRFPAGDSVQSGGWDGVVIEAPEGCAFVPEGFSVWEIGCESKTKTKADSDYLKRTENPLGADMANTTFVFVSPRAFQKRDEWVTEKVNEKKWKDVQALNADDLEAWLSEAPTVSAWLARQMGKVPKGVMALEDFWEEWSKATNPPVSVDLLAAGREKQAEGIVAWLSGQPSSFKVQADSSNEAIAFLFASIEKLQNLSLKQVLLSRCLITEDAHASRTMATEKRPCILIISGDNTDPAGQAIQNGHHVYIPLSNEIVSSKSDMKLPQISRERFVKALETMGYDHENAWVLMRTFGRSLTVFQRQCAWGSSKVPPWAAPEQARLLLPAFLVGYWSQEQDADRACLSALANDSYENLETQLSAWIGTSDSPFQKIGSVWTLRSRKDSWFLLARHITNTEWNKFQQKALQVLSEYDPKYDLEPNERYAAVIHGKVMNHSDFLRRGIVETLTLLAVSGKDAQVLLANPQEFCNAFVRALLTGKDWTRWASLSRLLPLLAEAGPDSFLDAVEDSLQQDEPPLAKLFMDSEDQNFPFGPQSPHPGLLWALENLAWYPEYLVRVVLALGKLDSLDVGGRIMNRPLNSLGAIFSIFQPGMIATCSERLQILDVLKQQQPETGWKLMVKLLTYDISHFAHKPEWRSIPQESPEQITGPYAYRSACEILDNALVSAENNVSRWKELVDSISKLPETKRPEIVRGLETVCEKDLIEEDRDLLCESLRALLGRHRMANRRGLDWALPVSLLNDLDEIYKGLEANDVARGNLWLFTNSWIDLPEGEDEDYHSKTQKVRERRCEAAQKIYEVGSVDLLLNFAEQVNSPGLLGQAAGDAQFPSDEIFEIIHRSLEIENEKLPLFSRFFIAECFQRHGWSWADSILNHAHTGSWRPEKINGFYLGLPHIFETWNRLEQEQALLQDLYWSRVDLDLRGCSTEELDYGARKLIFVNRPYAAFNSIRFEPEKLPTVTLMSLLELMASSSPKVENVVLDNMFSYEIGECFKSLYKDESADKNKIINLEWLYLPLLSRDHGNNHRPQFLLKSIEDDPKDFATLVKWIYKRDDDQEDEEQLSPEQIQNRARAAADLLDVWKKDPGFRRDQGEISGQKLNSWVSEVLELCENNGRRRVGERKVGEMLANLTAGKDGMWPDITVRDIIEEFFTESLGKGLKSGLYGKRGVTSRGMYDGGTQERELAQQYKSWSDSCRIKWPNTAKVLANVSTFYERYAEHEDHESEWRDLT